MAGAFLVSYVRAKAEGLGFSPGTGMAAVGIMPREVRLVMLGVDRGAAGNGFGNGGAAAVPAGILVIEGALAIIALGAVLTIVQRVLHVRAQASREVSERPS